MSSAVTRRDFVTAALVAGAGLARAADALSGPHAVDAHTPATAGLEWRNRNPEMRYRRLGRTGFMVSEIVCGGDPIKPDNIRHVQVAIGMGLNYLDTSPVYNQGLSEEGYSKVSQGADRDKVFINTKV